VFVPALERHEPAGHAVHEPAPAALKKPGAHATPTPVSVLDAIVCDALTVPAHVPEVQGFGESVRMVVPVATLVPVMTMPTEREPDATAEMVSAVPAISPVTPGAAKPAAQNDPAGHCAVHALVCRPVEAP
jgi:hypothetical protein